MKVSLRNLKPFRFALIALLMLCVYTGTYLALSARGGWHYSQTGNLRYGGGLSVTDVLRWQPAWARWETYRGVAGETQFRANWVGWIYSPLIVIDRAWVHSDQILFTASDLTK